jgi:5'(3')-deoxyribonucleotidase
MSTIRSLAIDVDNVLADSIARWCVLARSSGCSVVKEQIKSHKLVGSVPMEPRKIFELQDAVWRDWQNVPPTEPSQSAMIDELRKRHIKIMIVTSGPTRHGSGIQSWLGAHQLSYDEFHNLARGVSKATISADALVDDVPESVRSFTSIGRVGFLYSQPWNKTSRITNSIVIGSLGDIVKHLA